MISKTQNNFQKLSQMILPYRENKIFKKKKKKKKKT